jgi:uncharacterized protein YdeI (YjbR/CyaY-like superfamily)
MPDFIERALASHQLWDAYQGRPAYQRNDYIGWITSARQEATRRRRLEQMLEELRRGDRYMKMRWRPREGTRPHSV